MATEVLIYGAGRLGRQVLHHIETHCRERLSVRGFIDDLQPKGTAVSGTGGIVGSLAEAAADPRFSPDRVTLVMALGYRDLAAGWTAFRRAKERGYRFESFIHPHAVVDPSARLGEGVVVQAGAVIDQKVTLGDACYIDPRVFVGEDSRLGHHNYLAAGALVGGSVTMGDNNFLGLGAILVDGLTVGSENFINAGVMIARPLGDRAQVVEMRSPRLVNRT